MGIRDSMTSIPGGFAGGDCGNDKISIAIEAIADARKAADSIDADLYGEVLKYEKPFVVERDDITEKTFEDRERMCRPEIPQLSAEERKDNFSEVIPCGFTEEQAVAEASRCLECGCQDVYKRQHQGLSHQNDGIQRREPCHRTDPEKGLLCTGHKEDRFSFPGNAEQQAADRCAHRRIRRFQRYRDHGRHDRADHGRH